MRYHARLSALLLCMLGICLPMRAAVTVSLNDFTIAPGETKTVSVNLSNDVSDIKQLAFTLDMPDGLKIEDNSSAPDAGRAAGMLTAINSGTGYFLMRGIGSSRIKGTTGVVATFKVTATKSLAATSTISLSGVSVERDGSVKENGTGLPCTVTNTGSSSTTSTVAFNLSETSLTMSAGETKTVDVVMTNQGDFTGIEATFTATTGLTVTGVTCTSRLTNPVMFNFNATNGKAVYLGSSPITGTNGAVLSVTLQASPNFSGTATLNVTDIAATDAEAVNYSCDNLSLPVTVGASGAATFSFSKDYVSLGPNASAEVTVNLTSAFTVTAFQGTLVLPAGVTAQVTKSDRLQGSVFSYDAKTGNILYGVTPIPTNDGPVFTITLTADDTFISDAQLQLNNLNLTNASSVNIVANSLSLPIKAKDEATYNDLKTKINGLQKKLDETKEHINTNDKDVASDYSGALDNIQLSIKNLLSTFEAAYKDNIIDKDEKEGIEKSIATITSQIDATKSAADAAEAAYKQKVVDQDYAVLKENLAGLQNEYDEAANFIEKYCTVVNYTTQLATLQGRITTLKGDLETAKTNKSIDKADFNAKINAISQDIKDMKAEAIKKQAEKDGISPEFTQLYQNWINKINAVQQKLKEAIEQIRTDYPTIADTMESEVSAVQDKLGKVKSQLDDLYYTQALKASTTFDLASIEKDIAALITSAKSKNDKAVSNTYTTLKAEIALLQKQLDDNKANIQKDCDSEVTRVADADAAEIQALITKLLTNLDAQQKEGKLKADSKLDALTKKSIEDGIAAMYFKAIKSQNDKTYEALLQELKALENELGEARKNIETMYGEKAVKTVADDLTAIQKMIDEARATLKKQHDNILITKHTTVNQAAIQAAIQTAINKAKGDPENPDTPDNPDTPNPPSKEAQALYKALTADLNALQRQLDNAIAEMERKYDEDIVKATEKDFDELQKMIDEMNAKIEELYKANKLDKNTEIDKDAFIAAINKAKEATKALQAEKNYKAMTAVITDLETELAKAKEEVEKNAADVAEEYDLQFTLIEQLLTRLKNQVEKEQKEGMVNMNNMASADVIRNSLKTLLEDAAKRETAFRINQTLTEKLDRMEAFLVSAIEQIWTDCADVADGFKDEMTKIQQMIDDLREQLRKQYLNDELDENSDIDVTAVNQAITALLKTAQEAHTVGIARITMPEGATTEIYDLNGQRIDLPRKGTVVIVRMQDGRLRKMSVR